MRTHCCMCVCVCSIREGYTHLVFSSITPNNQTGEEGVAGRYVVMRKKKEKGGNYFWIKGPVDLFLFSASPLNLLLLHSASLSSFLSISIVLKAFPISHSLPARLFFFDFLWYPIPLCPHPFSAWPHPPHLFFYLFFFH